MDFVVFHSDEFMITILMQQLIDYLHEKFERTSEQ
jgi:hypothetical protein